MPIADVLRRVLPHKEIGWSEIGETFTRFTLVKTRWLTVFLHRLDAPNAHPQCHDHPWPFMTLILRGGYDEFHGGVWIWRKPGSILYRPAEFSHNVRTGSVVAWSMVIVGAKRREWGFQDAC